MRDILTKTTKVSAEISPSIKLSFVLKKSHQLGNLSSSLWPPEGAITFVEDQKPSYSVAFSRCFAGAGLSGWFEVFYFSLQGGRNNERQKTNTRSVFWPFFFFFHTTLLDSLLFIFILQVTLGTREQEKWGMPPVFSCIKTERWQWPKAQWQAQW